MATETTAELRLNAKGAAEVQAYFRLTPDTYITCHIYSDQAPILSLDDGPARVTITTVGTQVTLDDLEQAHRLFDQVDRYVRDCEAKFHAQDQDAREAA